MTRRGGLLHSLFSISTGTDGPSTHLYSNYLHLEYHPSYLVDRRMNRRSHRVCGKVDSGGWGRSR